LLDRAPLLSRLGDVAQEGHDRSRRFGCYFGEFDVDPNAPGPEGHPEILPIHADASSKRVAGERWHSDVSCFQEPPRNASGVGGRRSEVTAAFGPRDRAGSPGRCPGSTVRSVPGGTLGLAALRGGGSAHAAAAPRSAATSMRRSAMFMGLTPASEVRAAVPGGNARRASRRRLPRPGSCRAEAFQRSRLAIARSAERFGPTMRRIAM
jgi:hypothetical protein